MLDTIGSSIAKMYATEPRTPEEYTAEVDAYIDACREARTVCSP